MTKRHLIIPDVQHRPGDDTRFLQAIGNYIIDIRPDVVLQIGDFADMPSLSSYDVGKKSFEGRRYRADVESTREAMGELLKPLHDFNRKAKAGHRERYNPRMVLTLGNHEERIIRAVNGDPKLEGTIGIEDLRYREFGWEVYDFLQPVVVDGVAYCHYFVTGTAGRPCSTAQVQLTKKHMSCIAGHQQGLQIATGYRADGTRLTSVIAGSCYEHNEDYLGPQGNKHWRGVLVLHEVQDGEFDLMPVSLNYLKRKYV
jgi:hypothetical protein